jgi:thiol-disulfide isomerase/thioredoxin/uncharacterized membrane protein YphA (DoxX/SURF4 family)
MEMEIVLLMARLILAIVFGIAGVAKFADPEGSRKAMRGFGVPEALTTPFAWLLPIAEIIAAIALLPLSTAWFGGIGALVLLAAFLVGIGVNLAQGNAPDCHCFGQLHSEPVSWSVFVRNAVLAAIAGIIVIQGKDNPGLSAVDWLNDLRVGEAISLSLSAVAVALLIPTYITLRNALKQQTTMLEAVTAMKKIIDEDYAEPAPVEREDAVPPVEGLPVGAIAPAFSLPSLAGGMVSLEELLGLGKSVLLLFISPTCSPCKTLLPHVRVWQRDYGDHLTVVLMSKGTEKDVQAKIGKYEARYVILQGESSVADEYQSKWTPSAVLISRQGRIASPMTSGDEAIRALVTHAVATSESPAAAQNGTARPQIKLGNSLFKVGELAPRFALLDLQGNELSLDELLGRETLLLFWNPGCGYCKAMADDLKRWEARRGKNEPQVIFISTGEAEAVKKDSEGFQSLFLHDPDSDVMPMFGTNGTPSAVLLDAEGHITSSLAVGEKNILALLGIRKVELPIAKGLSNGAMVLEPSAETVTG